VAAELMSLTVQRLVQTVMKRSSGTSAPTLALCVMRPPSASIGRPSELDPEASVSARRARMLFELASRLTKEGSWTPPAPASRSATPPIDSHFGSARSSAAGARSGRTAVPSG